MLTVEKIGGTSMTKFKDVLQNIVHFPNEKEFRYGRVFVVSAYGGVTNILLEDKKTKEPGIYSRFVLQQNYEASISELLEKLKKLNESYVSEGLNLKEANEFIIERINQTKIYLKSMSKVISSGYVNENDIFLAARELLASIGEANSAYNMVNILNNNKIRAELVDLTGFHDPCNLTIDERIKKCFSDVDYKNNIVVATGYTRGTEGIMREFDRGYSEITFSKIAVLLKADEAIIHKEFHLSSADPNVVGLENTVVVGNTNYDVADQLADVGMEALHPKASKPLERANINLRIKNTFEPLHPGTLITKDYVGKESKIEMITGSEKVVVVEIYDSSMVGQVGFDLKLMKIFEKHDISYIMKTTNANSISVVIWEDLISEVLVDELNNIFEAVTIDKVAIVCMIGSNIAQPGVLAKVANILAGNEINVHCVSQSLRQVNMQFVIDREMYDKAVKCLNSGLCCNNK
ncbi:MAG: aspartate kinase [Clostridia bacterium]|nr:aspartate kinase [Clostridia bacterium]MDD4047878.1 aspartate kinase [Clostridia bacterium]